MILSLLLLVLGTYVSAYVVYQLVLFAANAVLPDAREFDAARIRRFRVLVPAHNEELYLPRLLASLAAQDYPKDRCKIIVIADNCTDGTAAVAARTGVDVLQRTNPTQRSKGYAIRWALEQTGLQDFDAMVVLDADSFVNRGFLKQLNLQLERGDRVIQSANAVANPDASWFTRLLDVSETMANDIVHPGKQKLGLSCHLLGNGMCFDSQVLRDYGWDAYSVGEDWEYYAKLVSNGVLVGYCGAARQYHQESVNLRQASSQRIRWSGGRFQVLQQYGPGMFRGAIRALSLPRLDACLPLVLPNPSLGMNVTIAGLVVAAFWWALGGSLTTFFWFLSLAALQMAMFLVAVLRTRNRVANALSLLLAPLFLAWKMGIDVASLFGAGTKEFKRTERRVS